MEMETETVEITVLATTKEKLEKLAERGHCTISDVIDDALSILVPGYPNE